MKTLTTLIQKIIPHSLRGSTDIGLIRRNYGQLRLILFSIMIVIAMGPVMMVAGLGYHNYKDLLRKEQHEQLEWQLDGSIKSIEALVESLKSVVQFTARRDRYTELVTGTNLEELFVRIKRQYTFFADLGVIDQSGIQQAFNARARLKKILEKNSPLCDIQWLSGNNAIKIEQGSVLCNKDIQPI